jgi:hypothetical protein
LTLGAQAVLHVINIVKGRMAAMAMPHSMHDGLQP